MEETDIPTALHNVIKRVEAAKLRRQQITEDVCVVAVSKTKPKSMIIEAYDCRQRHFGENYVNELVEKANDPEVIELCLDIKWHFIGHLQSNKVNKLVGVPNLYMIHTIDSIKLADLVDRAWSKLGKPNSLKIMIQIKTNGEATKNGIAPSEVIDLAKHIIENCNHICLVGLMLIGYADYDVQLGPNPEFDILTHCRDMIREKFNIELGLSMGMSHDFEQAIQLGSNYVRIGSSIFGARIKKA